MEDHYLEQLSKVLIYTEDTDITPEERIKFFHIRRYLFTLSLLFLSAAVFNGIVIKQTNFSIYYGLGSALMMIAVLARFRIFKFYVFIFIIGVYIAILFSSIQFGISVGNMMFFVGAITAIRIFYDPQKTKGQIALLVGIGILFFTICIVINGQLNITQNKNISDKDLSLLNVHDKILSMAFLINNLVFFVLIKRAESLPVDTNENKMYSAINTNEDLDTNHTFVEKSINPEDSRIDYELIEKKQELAPEVGLSVNDNQKHDLCALIIEKNPLFLYEFRKEHPILTDNIIRLHQVSTTDLRFCALIFLDYSSKEIATHLNLSYRTVQSKKNKLRKKFGLVQYADLYEYIKGLNH